MAKSNLNKYLILMQLMLLNIGGQSITQCAARIQTEKIATEIDLELIEAARFGEKQKVEKLIIEGANINAADNSGWTALLRATSNCHNKIVELLIERGANVNAACKWGITALLNAVRQGNIEIIKLLVKAHADVNAAETGGYTALILAVSKGHIEIVELLIKANADVNMSRENGFSALIHAARDGHKEIVELLLKAGANMEHKNIIGEKAIDQAGKFGFLEIVKILEDEPSRREKVIKNNQNWIKENFAKKITESTSAQLIPDISNIIAQYATEYNDLPLDVRLGIEENKEKNEQVNKEEVTRAWCVII